MTQINSFQDLLNLLDSNPQYLQALRARILSAELIALPEKFAELVAQVTELSAKFDEFVAATDRRFAALETDVKVLKDDVKVLKDDVGALKGSDTERRVRDNILNIAKDELGLTRGRVLLRGSGDVDAQLRAAIDRGEALGVVAENDVDNLLVADIIIRARKSIDRRYAYAVIEVSRTINDWDINRARNRATSVAAITGDEAIAVVIGGAIYPQQRELAAQSDVQVVIPAMFRAENVEGYDD
jgi:hypothetical protein